MKQLAAFLLFFSFLSALFACTADTSETVVVLTADRQYDYARKCFEQKDFQAAVVEFKRFVHFFPEDRRCFEARMAIGQSLYYSGEYERAAAFFDEITGAPETDVTLMTDAYIMKSRAYLMIGKTGHAGAVLRNLLTVAETAEARDRAHAALAVVYLRMAAQNNPRALNSALKSIRAIGPEGMDSGKKRMIEERIAHMKNAGEKDPLTAGIASVIPGGGYIYLGRYKDGAVSFLFNTALMLAACTSFDEGNNALGAVITFVEAGFYAGNVYGAVSSAHKQNARRRGRGINDLMARYYPFHPADGKLKDDRIRVLFKIPF